MRGAQQVLFVLGIGFQAGPDVVLNVIFLQVQNVQLGSAGLEGLFFQAVQLSALANVAGNSNNFAVVVVLFQPGNDDGGIQTAGVSQNNLFNIFLFLFHKNCPLSKSYPPKWLNIYSFHASYYTRPATNCNTAYCTRKIQLIEITLFYSLHFAAQREKTKRTICIFIHGIEYLPHKARISQLEKDAEKCQRVQKSSSPQKRGRAERKR